MAGRLGQTCITVLEQHGMEEKALGGKCITRLTVKVFGSVLRL